MGEDQAGKMRNRAASRPGINPYTAYSQPRSEDKPGADYDIAGRLDGDVIASYLTLPEAHYLLCGPLAFMADIQTALEARGIPSERIHTESFGPAA